MCLQYLSKEEEYTFVIVKLILSFNQMWALHPEVSSLNLDSCVNFRLDHADQYRELCCQFVSSTAEYMPFYSKRLKTHLVLHLVESIIEFGPIQYYNIERFLINLVIYNSNFLL